MSFIAPLGVIASIAGGFATGAGAMQSATAASASSNYQAVVAANNATLADEASDRTLDAGAQRTQDVSMKAAANVGTIKARQAESGVDVNSGTALNVQASARELGELAATRTQNNAEERAWGYRVAASNDTAQAELDLMTGKNQIAAGEQAQAGDELKGLGTGLVGAATALSPKWSQGIFGS
jgi:hypothetical protein